MAGRSDMPKTAAAAKRLFSDNLAWGLDDAVWDRYGIVGQPATVLIKDGVIVDSWYGALEEMQLRDRLDSLTG